MQYRHVLIAIGAMTMLAIRADAQARGIPPFIVPDGLGVNIHFTTPMPGEMDMMAAAGFRWVRMDFAWSGTEREAGKYDFSAYDTLLSNLEPKGIRAIFILDYSNRLYDGDQSPNTDMGRAAFAKWAAAAAKHFAGHGILWEMYNEPNITFWRPKPNVDDYAKLALATGKALREAAAREIYIGPATSGIDMRCLETCFKAGLLEYWSAVSVHPYRQINPESAAREFRNLRRLIAKYAPKGKQIPIISGEWGYSSGWNGIGEDRQGKMLPREWLTNLSNGVPVSIWYDWHDDGTSPTDPEHHFGTVFNAYHAGNKPVYDPKPAYLAAKALTTALNGFRYNKRLDIGSPEDFVLLFSRGDDVKLAVWTTSSAAHPVTIPASPGRFVTESHTAEGFDFARAEGGSLTVTASDSPLYLTPEKPNDLLRVAAAWDTAPLEVVGPAAGLQLNLGFHNPLPTAVRLTEAISTAPAAAPGTEKLAGPNSDMAPGATTTFSAPLDVGRSADPVPVRVTLTVAGMGSVTQSTYAIVTDPLRVSVLPPCKAADTGQETVLPIRVESAPGQSFHGTLRLLSADGPAAGKGIELNVRGTTTVKAPMAGGTREYSCGVELDDAAGKAVLRLPVSRHVLVDDFSRYPSGVPYAYRVLPDGDPKVASTQDVTAEAPPAGPPMPGLGCLKIAYKVDAGWKFIRLTPKSDDMARIQGKPRAFGLWVHGDGHGGALRVRIVDSTGQTFQPGWEDATWTGWRYVETRIDDPQVGRWGGANDRHHPLSHPLGFALPSRQRQPAAGSGCSLH